MVDQAYPPRGGGGGGLSMTIRVIVAARSWLSLNNARRLDQACSTVRPSVVSTHDRS